MICLARELNNLEVKTDVVVPDDWFSEKAQEISPHIIPLSSGKQKTYDLAVCMNPLFTSLSDFSDIRSKNKAIYILHLKDDQYTSGYQQWIDHFQGIDRFWIFGNNSHCPVVYRVPEKSKYFDLIGGYDDIVKAVDERKRSRKVSILFNASATRWKGSSEIVLALERMHNIDSVNMYAFASRSVNLNTNLRIKIEFNVPFKRMGDIYNHSDLFIYFEDKNAGWGNTAFEAIMAGVPVICTKYGTQAFAEHMKNAYVINRDTVELKHAINLLVNDSNLRNRITVNREQRKQLINKFSYKTIAEKIVRLVDANTGR
ncbi:hypothetical protein D1BOALGB6SA_4853 [Olavius sp. associated proteobacterium Delta 1]|nr:hypothetical protein D1BOALGB6SA_4853 [Olavius sp. associated proteobacterium Delta 1]